MAYPDPPIGIAPPVLHWREGAIAHLRFNRPAALNAIDRATAAAFLEACTAIAADKAVRAVRISGEGRMFMAGGDLRELLSGPAVAADLIAGMHGGIQMLSELDAPVVAQVHGAVAGAGLGVALACDIVVAAQGTRFSLAYPAIGASCDCGTSWSLPRLVGTRQALGIALLGDTVDADEAQRMGMVNAVVPADRLDAAVEAMVRRLASGPTVAYGHLKRLMRSGLESALPVQLAKEAAAFQACASTADFREGASAFLGKREAHFRGA